MSGQKRRDPGVGSTGAQVVLRRSSSVRTKRGSTRALENAEIPWLELVTRELQAAVESGAVFDAAHLRQKCGEPDHPSRWGGVLSGWANRGLIEHAGVVVNANGDLRRQWRGARAKAGR